MTVNARKDEIEEIDEDIVEQDTDESDADEVDEEAQHAEWDALDASFDREDGPFDIEEVDLEADDEHRLDLGTLVLTPFENMQLQLQVDQAKEHVQAFLVGDGASAMEVALFAGPTRTSMLNEIRSEIVKATEAQDGTIEVVQGPFGAELRRRLPVTDPEGRPAIHLSRTWLVGGPGWVLRGVLMGKAALEPDNEDADLKLFEFFANLVVRRGSEPAAPGSLLKMSVPDLQANA